MRLIWLTGTITPMDEMLRWVTQFLDADSMEELLKRDQGDACEAIKRARRIDSKHAKTALLLESHPRGREVLAANPHRGESQLPANEAADRGLRIVFEVVLNAARKTVIPELIHRLDHVHPVFLDHDDAFANSETFSDGSALIRMSDALLTACSLVSAVNAWRLIDSPGPRGAGREWPTGNQDFYTDFEPGLRPGIAALRYYILQQRVWGIAGKIYPNRVSEARDDMYLTMMFVEAHEIGHHVLEHVASGANGEQQELEADHFAFRLLHQIHGTSPKAHAEVFAAASMALMAIDLHDRGLFIRLPQSHPGFGERWSALTNLLEISETSVPLAARDLIEAVLVAARNDLPLLPTDWDALRASPAWDTSFRTDEYMVLIHGLDLSATYTFDFARELLAGGLAAAGGAAFLPGLLELDSDGPAAALRAWEVSDGDKLLDPGQPLGFHSLVEAFLDSALWPARSGDPEINERLVSLICANQLLPHLRGAVGLVEISRE